MGMILNAAFYVDDDPEHWPTNQNLEYKVSATARRHNFNAALHSLPSDHQF
jgi:hypothetical protein